MRALTITVRRQKMREIWGEETSNIIFYARLVAIALLFISTIHVFILGVGGQRYGDTAAWISFGLTLPVLIALVALHAVPHSGLRKLIRALTALGAILCIAAGLVFLLLGDTHSIIEGSLGLMVSMSNLLAGSILFAVASAALAKLDIKFEISEDSPTNYSRIRQSTDVEAGVLVETGRPIGADSIEEDHDGASKRATEDLRGSMDSFQGEGARLLP